MQHTNEQKYRILLNMNQIWDSPRLQKDRRKSNLGISTIKKMSRKS